ncbi:MAG: DUF3108 domain-containing protein [Candidatus Palauibacterales bacterium]|nr:DUF3108 domain-containing protein [Candidatus Palauibacterales bacterium]MDP2482548.1 DUF3108 domain-containing protein [Candidatus Palauibacterales bacterium]
MTPVRLSRHLLPFLALLAVGPRPAGAQATGPGEDIVQPWRFPVGERMEFSVSWGRVRLGEGSLEVEAIDSIGGQEGYRVALEMWGGPPFYRVQDRQVSWIRPDPLGSLRFEQSLSEGSYKRDTRYSFDFDRMTYDREDLVDDEWRANGKESDVPLLGGALDDLSFIYFARLLPLEVGERYEFDRYFKEAGNPVVIEVLRREEIRVPAGTFQTIVVRPIIRTGGAFGDGGEAELYLTDDEHRAIVRLKTSMAVGSGNMFLTRYEPGEGALIPVAAPLSPASSGPSSAAGDRR